MYEIYADTGKNRLYLTLEGVFEEDEAKAAANECMREIDKLEAGFTILNDIFSFRPTNKEATKNIVAAQHYASEKGAKRGVRVVGSGLGKMQFKLTEKQAHVDYTMADVGSWEKSEEISDNWTEEDWEKNY